MQEARKARQVLFFGLPGLDAGGFQKLPTPRGFFEHPSEHQRKALGTKKKRKALWKALAHVILGGRPLALQEQVPG